MSPVGTLMLVTFVVVSSLVLLAYLVVTGRRSRVQGRLEELSQSQPDAAPVARVQDLATTALPRVGAALVPSSEQERTKLQTRLIHAGFYGKQAMQIFLGAKVALLAGGLVLGALVGATGLLKLPIALLLGAAVGGAGLILPTFWLDSRKAARQSRFRRALPDAMDVLVICLEGGSSLMAALDRVGRELRSAHPELALELQLCQREIQMGRTAGEALREVAGRTDLEEMRTLAAVVQQSERFGASLVKALRVHAETLRSKRLLRAEEMAQKAVVKMLIPTILFIFPAMFIVVLGPPLVEVAKKFPRTAVMKKAK